MQTALEGFLPAVRDWFVESFGEASPPQELGWPRIAEGKHTLIAAPTGSGKTLAAFLHALDSLFRQGQDLPDETQVLYVSPLRALGNDVQKNLQQPLREICAKNLFLPELRVLVRNSDTSPNERQSMLRKPPHVLVTTPESLYILLTSQGGRKMLRGIRTVIVDEIHALVRDKRGSHFALSLERLEDLTGGFQRIGLSATQKPLSDVGRFLGGVYSDGEPREVELVDAGHLREIDLAIEIPGSPLETICSHEVWDEIYAKIVKLIEQHSTTLVFVNTRKLAERVAARLTDLLGIGAVASHHGSLSKEIRLDAETKLKNGQLKALVATASLELGIDIGDVDLAIQIGTTSSIATLLQRVGRAGHALSRTPKGRLFPLTIDELVCAAALLRCVRSGELDRTPQPPQPLDILAQQIVAACAARDWPIDELYAAFKRAWPYRDLTREDFDACVELHTRGRYALLHKDGVGNRLLATKRARIPAVTCGGAIPDLGDYHVICEPEGNLVGSLNEDFAIESNVGDIIQLGNTSWRVLRIERGVLRVADAKGLPPTLPFWLGEGPSRTFELSREIARIREDCDSAEWLEVECGVQRAAAEQIAEYLLEARRALGRMPTQDCIIAERFFDESGGMQLVVHAPFGGRINRAWGLALRKKFCRGFGFELQAAANEEAYLLSLGPMHSFKLDDIFDYLKAKRAEYTLQQASLGAPMFQSRWRWNITRSLLVERMKNGARVPAPLQRFRADDALAQAFPQVAACPENLPGGDLPIPMEHPIVRQTIEDCLREAMDVDGLIELLERLESGKLETHAVDLPEPSPLARGILAAQPYAFLDDAPLEERRTQAVYTRRALSPRTIDEVGELDGDAVARVRDEAWPRPDGVEELHEALLWMGFLSSEEVDANPIYGPWIAELLAAGRVEWVEGQLFAIEAPRDPVEVWRGRLEALGPVFSDDPALLQLESQGAAMRCRIDGRDAWCDRRLLARIHRYTIDRLRREIEPVSAAQFLRFLSCWQHVDDKHRLHGAAGVREVLRQLAGYEAPAPAWEASILPARVRGYRREWLDECTLTGEFAWGRLWGASSGPIKTTPVTLVPRGDLVDWLGLAAPCDAALSPRAHRVAELLEQRGAIFPQELERLADFAPGELEDALAELIGKGLLSCDSWGGLRALIVPPSRRKQRAVTIGRWCRFRNGELPAPDVDFVAKRLLTRWGVVVRKALAREKLGVSWRELLRCFRRLELRGEVRGGRFVQGFDGEQFALPEAIAELRRIRREGGREELRVAAADPLNLAGILTPNPRISPNVKRVVQVL